MDASDIVSLREQLDAAERDAQGLVADLSEEQGVWRPDDRSWSVAQCLEHLARTNGMYLEAMGKAGSHAREQRRFRVRPAVPGLLGRWVVRSLEPPARAPFRFKAPRNIQPSQTASLSGAVDGFMSSQEQVRGFLAGHSDLDLASIRFANPFVPGVPFTLAVGLHIITAHERRHLWQAWGVRRATEGDRRPSEFSAG